MSEQLRKKLEIGIEQLNAINGILLNPDMQVINDFLDVVAKYGTPEEINQKAIEAGKLDHLFDKVIQTQPKFIKDLEWLIEQRDRGAFIGLDEYRRNVLGSNRPSKINAGQVYQGPKNERTGE
jgi:hypothetical protein